MNIYGPETFLIGIIASTLILSFFIYLRIRALKLQKIRYTPTFRHGAPTFPARKSKSSKMRKGIEFKPTVTGYLSVYPIVRPEAALSQTREF